MEYPAARILQRPAVWVIDCLPEQSIGIGHDWRDHVYQLGQTGDLDAVRVAQQRDHEAADQERIFEVIDLFQQMRRLTAMTIHCIPAALTIPDVPFIERQP